MRVWGIDGSNVDDPDDDADDDDDADADDADADDADDDDDAGYFDDAMMVVGCLGLKVCLLLL